MSGRRHLSPPPHQGTGIRVATLNVATLTGSKRAALPHVLAREGVHVAALQEVARREGASGTFPPGWDHAPMDVPAAHEQVKGRGQAVLGAADALHARGLRLYAQADDYWGEAYDLQCCALGDILVLNLYMHCGEAQGAMEQLVEHVFRLRGPSSPPAILLGDFNPPPDAAAFYQRLGEALGMVPAITAVTRQGRTLDQIFVSPDLAVRACPVVQVPTLSDHGLVIVDVELTGPPRPPIPPERCVRWRRLTELDETALAALDTAIRALPPQPNLARANESLMALAAQHLGTFAPRRCLRHVWWTPHVAECWGDLHDFRKSLPAQTGTWTTAMKRHKDRLLKTFRQAAKAAQAQGKRDYLQKLSSGKLDLLYQAMSKKGRRTVPLAPGQAAPFWRAVWTPASPAASARDPYVQDPLGFVVTPEELLTAIKATADKAPGPDGLRMKFLHTFGDALAPMLAPLFTAAFEDPPVALKHGMTVLLPKGSSPAADPSKYRPITLLPCMQRVLARLVDRILRHEAAATGSPVTMSPAQAGFMPDRSCHEQALLFHIIQDDAQQRQQPLYAVLLDIAKAFDELDHGVLLDIMGELGYSARHQELVRRMLVGGSTTLEGVVLELLRGAPQGSPCSPFLAVIYFESLARVIRAYVVADPLGAPDIFSKYGCPVELVLSVLLQFADDTTLLGADPEWLQGLLEVVTKWAADHLIRFNGTKSLGLRASLGRQDAVRGAPAQLTVQGQVIPMEREGVILGVPIRAQASRGPSSIPFQPRRGAVAGSMAQLQRLFTVVRGRQDRGEEVLVDFTVLVKGIQQVVLPRVLFAAPVVDLNTEQIDRDLRRGLRALLGLPNTFPSVGLHWLLRLWPSRLLLDFAKLKQAWRCHHQYWSRHLLQVWRRPGARTASPALQTGPLGLITTTLRRYGLAWTDLEHPDYAPDPANPSSRLGYRRWAHRCWSKVSEAFHSWAVKAGSRLPRHSALHHHFPRDLAVAQEQCKAGLPAFLTNGGDYGRAGLRLLAGTLQDGPAGDGPCVWCQSPTLPPHHLFECRGIPEALKDLRRAAKVKRALEAAAAFRREQRRAPPEGYAKQCEPEWNAKLVWPGISEGTAVHDLLWFVGQAIDAYSAAAHRARPTLGTRVRPVKLAVPPARCPGITRLNLIL